MHVLFCQFHEHLLSCDSSTPQLSSGRAETRVYVLQQSSKLRAAERLVGHLKNGCRQMDLELSALQRGQEIDI